MRTLMIGSGPRGQQRAALLGQLGVKNCFVDLDVDVPPDVAESLVHSFVRAWKLASPASSSAEAAFVCTAPETRVSVASACLAAGIGAVFIEQPGALSLAALEQLAQIARKRIVMAGCNLRFAYRLPEYQWALLDVVSRHPFPPSSSGTGPSESAILARLVDEIDLAYALNGPIKAMRTIGRSLTLALDIEHENLAGSHFELDWSTRAGPERYAVIAAFDDGAALRVPHEPKRYEPDTSERMLKLEMRHFLQCVRNGRRPCNTIEDATHVLRCAIEIVAATRDHSPRDSTRCQHRALFEHQ